MIKMASDVSVLNFILVNVTRKFTYESPSSLNLNLYQFFFTKFYLLFFEESLC